MDGGGPRQLTIAAVARPVRGGVGAPGVLAAARSGGCSSRRRLPGGASSRSRGVGRGRRGRHGQQARHGVGRRCPPMRCPPIRSWRPGSGCPAVRCPVTWGRRPERPAVGRLLSTRPGSSRPLSTRAVSSRLLSAPVGPDASVSSHSGGGVGTRSRWPGDRGHQNRWRPRRLPSRRRLDRRSRRPGRGRGCRRRVGQWEFGGGPGPPGWVRAAAAAAWLPSSGWGRDHGGWSSPSLTAGWADPEGPGEVPAGMGVRPQRGPSRQRAFPARCQQRSDL